MSVWHILGMEPGGDERAIKRAYARRLKETRPEDDPAAFQALRDAYETALGLLAQEQPAMAAPDMVPDMAADMAPPATAALPVDAAADVSGPDPVQEARRLWLAFLAAPLQVQPRRHLAAAMAQEEMHDLRVREAFELHALQYCAGDACPDDLREAIADYFAWEDDPGYIERRLPEQAWETLARLRAWRSYQHLLAQASDDKAVRALLADDAGRERGSTWNARFTLRMQQLVQDIRIHHPELLHFRLNRSVFDTWERRVEGRRYFPSTAFASLVAGLVAWSLSAQFLARFDYPHAGLVNFIAIEALVLGLVAWYVLRRKDRPGQRNPLLQTVLHDIRYRPSWQLGWLPVYALASAALYIPAPPDWLVGAVTLAMVVCVAMATFANSPLFHPLTYVASFGGGFSLGQSMIEQRFPDQALACILGAIVAIQLLYRGGSDLFDWSGIPARRLLPMRLCWLAGAAGFVAMAATLALPVHAFLAAAWLWLLAGMLLSRPSINPIGVMLAALVVRVVIDRTLPASSLLNEQPMPLITYGFIVVAMFMGVNIFRANQNQHQFS